MNYKFKYTRTVINIFMAIAFLSVAAGIISILINEKFFERKYIYKAKFGDATGFKANTPVFFKGFKIGYVTNFDLDEDNFVYGDVYIYEDFKNRITLNSVLYKNPNFITSLTTVILIPGSDNSVAAEGTLLPGIDVPEGKDIQKMYGMQYEGDFLTAFVFRIQTLLDEINPKIIDGDTLTSPLFATFESIITTAETVNRIVKNLDSTLSIIYEGLDSESNNVKDVVRQLPELTSNLNDATVKATQTLTELDKLLVNYNSPDSLAIKMIDPTGENLFKPIRTSINELNQILPEVKSLMNYSTNQTTNVTIILERIKLVLDELHSTLQNVNANPLIGGSKEVKEGVGGKRRPVK